MKTLNEFLNEAKPKLPKISNTTSNPMKNAKIDYDKSWVSDSGEEIFVAKRTKEVNGKDFTEYLYYDPRPSHKKWYTIGMDSRGTYDRNKVEKDLAKTFNKG